jgi:amino acid adenylation domain-containing protein
MNKIQYTKKEGQYIGQGEVVSVNKKETVGTLFENQVRRTPKATALCFNEIFLTYDQLNRRVNQFAHHLELSGLVPKSPVGVYLNPGIEMIIAILAILKTGCYYVPLDVNYPAGRIHFMLKDSDAQWLITQSTIQNTIAMPNLQIVNIDPAALDVTSPFDSYQCKAKSNDLAYMIYTSGSTGVPKGVQITHLAVNNHMTWMHHQFQLDSCDKILLKTPLSFDPSVWECFMPILTGAVLVVAPAGSHVDPELLIDLVCQHHITIIQMVPSILKQFLNSKRIKDCHTLKKVYVGGESLRPEIKALFFKKLGCRLINLYGPTEATIDSTFHEVLDTEFNIHSDIIGKPIVNTSIYLVNEEGNLAVKGEAGELFIGSLSLSKGYYKNDALTKEYFIDNPFEPEHFSIIYKTGDLARWLPTGELEYIGRNNDQVKINGVRIEPKELVLTILQHEEVSDCIVIKKTDTHGHDYLACYLTHKPHQTLDILAIKTRLKNRFPTFMLPRVYIPINKIPLTVNGKVDVNALPKVNLKKTATIDNSEGDLLELEHDLLLMWQLILEVNQIGIHDDFFDAGGSSLLALKLLTLIHEQFHVTMRLRDIFEYSTVKRQTEHIKKLQQRIGTLKKKSLLIPNPIITLQSKGLKTPLFLIHPIGGTIFWFSHLAKLLGTSRPVYGIQDPSIDLEKPVLSSIEEIAQFYLSHIKKIQPQGPYLIGGASFGATVAVELSRQLAKINELTSAVFVLDGWGVYPKTLLNDNYFRDSMLRQHEELKIDFKKYELPPPEILFDIQWYRLNLLWNYQLNLLTQPIVLFKSQEIMPAFIEIDAPFNHWEQFTNKEIKTIIVPGNHETMFQEPHVYELAKALNQYLAHNNL